MTDDTMNVQAPAPGVGPVPVPQAPLPQVLPGGPPVSSFFIPVNTHT